MQFDHIQRVLLVETMGDIFAKFSKRVIQKVLPHAIIDVETYNPLYAVDKFLKFRHDVM
jgi:hypothetical protein